MTMKHDSPGSSGGKGPLTTIGARRRIALLTAVRLVVLRTENLRGGPSDSADHAVNPSAQIPDRL